MKTNISRPDLGHQIWGFLNVPASTHSSNHYNPDLKSFTQGFPGGTVVKNLPANAGDTGSILVWEDPTCRGATKPARCNYWACALEPASHNYWAHVPQLLKPRRLEPVLHNKGSHDNEKPAHRNEE